VGGEELRNLLAADEATAWRGLRRRRGTVSEQHRAVELAGGIGVQQVVLECSYDDAAAHDHATRITLRQVAVVTW